MSYLCQADLLAQEWGRLMAVSNDWGTEKSDSYTELFVKSFNRAITEKNLKTRDRLGLVTSTVDIPQNQLFIDLKDFCEWGKTGSNLGIPLDEYELAALLKIDALTEDSYPLRAEQICPPPSSDIKLARSIAHAAPHLFFSGEMDVFALSLTPSVVISSAPYAPPSEFLISQKIPASQCATPDELIATFGELTGMNKKWFRSLKGTPGLLQAMVYAGRSGKSSDSSNQPLFCPTRVMLWLSKDNKKRGFKKLPSGVGIKLLKRDYPKSYEVNAAYLD